MSLYRNGLYLLQELSRNLTKVMPKMSSQSLKNQKKEEQTKRLNECNAEPEPNPKELGDNRCPNCNRVFLWKQPMQKHINSKKCMESKKTKTLEEINASFRTF